MSGFYRSSLALIFLRSLRSVYQAPQILAFSNAPTNNFCVPFIQAFVCVTDMLSWILLTGFVAILEYKLDIAIFASIIRQTKRGRPTNTTAQTPCWEPSCRCGLRCLLAPRTATIASVLCTPRSAKLKTLLTLLNSRFLNLMRLNCFVFALCIQINLSMTL